MRKLATIRRIRSLTPIAGADKIELARLDDWFCIVKKGEFQVNDNAVYLEVDSFLPEEDRYAFLASCKKTYQGVVGYHIKTMKMKGVISQGLALPLNLFPELQEDKIDVTDQLKVIKYEVSSGPIATATSNHAGNFPSFIPKTEQERIQNLPTYYEYHSNDLFEETLKLDGSSITMYKIALNLNFLDKVKKFFGFSVNTSHFGVCSRNLEIEETLGVNNAFWDVAYKYDIRNKLPIGYALQGELVGPKIQGNREKVTENRFFIFDVWDITRQQYLTPAERKNFVARYFDLKLHVPVVNEAIPIFQECRGVADLLKRVEGESFNPNTLSAGRVYKMRHNPAVSFKVINPKYLLRYESKDNGNV